MAAPDFTTLANDSIIAVCAIVGLYFTGRSARAEAKKLREAAAAAKSNDDNGLIDVMKDWSQELLTRARNESEHDHARFASEITRIHKQHELEQAEWLFERAQFIATIREYTLEITKLRDEVKQLTATIVTLRAEIEVLSRTRP